MKEYIGRNYLLSVIATKFNDHFKDTKIKAIHDFYRCVIRVICSAPSENVTETGYAEWFLLDNCSNEGVYCSNCLKKVYKADYANQKVKSKFCPNCGKRMRSNKYEKDSNIL